MATFIGFNTIGQNKQFTAVDFNLVKIDLLNAFNIRQGELIGRPGYGTILWDYLFENQTQEIEQAIYNEVQRVCGGDPRIYLNSTNVYPQQNGILLELELIIVPTTDPQRLSIFFDQTQRVASYV